MIREQKSKFRQKKQLVQNFCTSVFQTWKRKANVRRDAREGGSGKRLPCSFSFHVQVVPDLGGCLSAADCSSFLLPHDSLSPSRPMMMMMKIRRRKKNVEQEGVSQSSVFWMCMQLLMMVFLLLVLLCYKWKEQFHTLLQKYYALLLVLFEHFSWFPDTPFLLFSLLGSYVLRLLLFSIVNHCLVM